MRKLRSPSPPVKLFSDLCISYYVSSSLLCRQLFLDFERQAVLDLVVVASVDVFFEKGDILFFLAHIF